MMAGSHLLSWKYSKKEKILLSSAEAKYKSLSDLSQEVAWISTLAVENNLPLKAKEIEVAVDNKAAIDLDNSKTDQNSFRTKHMDLFLHFVQESVQSKVMNLSKFNLLIILLIF